MRQPPPGADAAVARYPYVVIDVDPAEADEASAFLFELGATGVEQRDETTLDRGASSKITFAAAFERPLDARAAAERLVGEWSPRVEEVVGDAWRDEWKKHFEPFRIAGEIIVCPPWRAVEARGRETIIVLEPGRAFGTGLHETTSLVCGALVDCRTDLRGASLLDVGCGSGILSFVGLALGVGKARAVDLDADAVSVTQENALRNGLETRVYADATPVEALDDHYDVVVANIESCTLVSLAPALLARLAPGGLLVLSGILADKVAPTQLEDIRAAYATLREDEVRERGDWVAVVMRA